MYAPTRQYDALQASWLVLVLSGLTDRFPNSSPRSSNTALQTFALSPEFAAFHLSDDDGCFNECAPVRVAPRVCFDVIVGLRLVLALLWIPGGISEVLFICCLFSSRRAP